MPDSQLSCKCSRFPCYREGIVEGVRDNDRTGKIIGNRPSEMLKPGRGIKENHFVFEEPQVPEDRGKKGILGAETAGAGLLDPPITSNRRFPVTFTENRFTTSLTSGLRVSNPPRDNPGPVPVFSRRYSTH
jgi:hypothetical protein